MHQKIRTILLITTILAIAFSCSAIASTITLKGGVSRAEGDIEEDKQIDGLIGLSYEVWMAKWISLGVHPYVTRLQAGTEGSTRNFKSDIIGGDLLIKLRPFSLFYYEDAAIYRIAPYLVGGGGVVNYYPKDLEDNPLGGDPDSAYPYTFVVAPVYGGGLTFFTGAGIDFDFGVQVQILNTDYLDGLKENDDNDAIWMAYMGFSHTFGLKQKTKPKPETVEVIEEIKPMLMLRQNALNVSKEAGQTSIGLISNTAWTLTKDADWLSVSPMSGNGDSNIYISYSENELTTSRTGKITIRGSGLAQTITVVQGVGKPRKELFVEDRTRYITSEPGTLEYNITSDVPWTVEEDVDWFSVSPVSGSNEGTIMVRYESNSARKPRSGQIVIKGDGLNQTLTIMQERNKPVRYEKSQPSILKGVNFKVGSAELSKESYEILDEAVATLVYYPELNIEIQGHTDSTGSLKLNNQLSLDRANAVKNYLVSKGIEAGRLTTKGYGPERPIASNNTPQGRAENRRIEFHVN